MEGSHIHQLHIMITRWTITWIKGSISTKDNHLKINNITNILMLKLMPLIKTLEFNQQNNLSNMYLKDLEGMLLSNIIIINKMKIWICQMMVKIILHPNTMEIHLQVNMLTIKSMLRSQSNLLNKIKKILIFGILQLLRWITRKMYLQLNGVLRKS